LIGEEERGIEEKGGERFNSLFGIYIFLGKMFEGFGGAGEFRGDRFYLYLKILNCQFCSYNINLYLP